VVSDVQLMSSPVYFLSFCIECTVKSVLVYVCASFAHYTVPLGRLAIAMKRYKETILSEFFSKISKTIEGESLDADLSAAAESTPTRSYSADAAATTAQESVLNDECHPNDFGLAVGVGDQLSDADKLRFLTNTGMLGRPTQVCNVPAPMWPASALLVVARERHQSCTQLAAAASTLRQAHGYLPSHTSSTPLGRYLFVHKTRMAGQQSCNLLVQQPGHYSIRPCVLLIAVKW